MAANIANAYAMDIPKAWFGDLVDCPRLCRVGRIVLRVHHRVLIHVHKFRFSISINVFKHRDFR